MASGSQRLREALNILDDRSLSQVMVGLMLGTMMTMAYQFWEFISSLGATIMTPFQMFADALGTLITGSIGGPVVMLEAAIQTGVYSVTEGLWATFGIFAYPVTMIAVMMGIYIFAWAWSRVDLSPWNFVRSIRR